MSKKVKTLATREEIMECTKKIFISTGLSPEIDVKIIESIVNGALEDGVSVEDMRRKSGINKRIAEKNNIAVRNGQPAMLFKVDAKTGLVFTKYNTGDYNLRFPNPLTLYHDTHTALMRLSEDKEWVPLDEIYNNITNMSYAHEWRPIVFDHINFASAISVLEIREDSSETRSHGIKLEIRLIPCEKTELIKQLITVFDRPEPEFLDPDPDPELSSSWFESGVNVSFGQKQPNIDR